MKYILMTILTISVKFSFCQVNRYMGPVNTPIKQTYVDQYVPLPYEELKQYAQIKQELYDKKMAQEKENTLKSITLCNRRYSTIPESELPTSIRNGWHEVTVSNGYDFIDFRKVYVSDNKITQYVIDDWIQREVTVSGIIQKAKSPIRLKDNDDFLDVYFFNYIYDPSSYTTAPSASGKISFYTNFKKSGTIKIYIDNEYLGSLSSYFPDGSPNCEQNGTVTFEYKPGTYTYKAVSENYKWSGNITIVGNQCNNWCLSNK